MTQGQEETRAVAVGPSIASHCPDFTVTVDREVGAVVVTLLGTRCFPSPSIHDIIMDLRAETRPFLSGQAHAGMVIGVENLLGRSLPVLQAALEREPGLSVLVVGYSLGAGLAQLYTASLLEGEAAALLPPGTEVLALCYGAPPVYQSEDGKTFPQIVIIHNNKDGVIGASIRTINDLFYKTVAIDAENIDTKVMMEMIFERIENERQDSVEEEVGGEEEEEGEEGEGRKSWTGRLAGILKKPLSHVRDGIQVSLHQPCL